MKLFFYGCGGLDKHCKTCVLLESYMTNAIQLSSRCFFQQNAFFFVVLDVVAYNHATTFVHCKICPIDAKQATTITIIENLRI